MTRERAWEQAEIEFKFDGKVRFVDRKRIHPEPYYLITKWYAPRTGWYRIGNFDKAGKHDSEVA